MKNIVFYISLLFFLFASAFALAEDGKADMPKDGGELQAQKAKHSIPKISANAVADGSSTPKTNSSVGGAAFPVYDNKDLPQVESLPNGKKSKSLTEEIKKAGRDEKEAIEEGVDNLIKDTWVEKLGDSLSNLGNSDKDAADASDEEEESLESLTQKPVEEKKSNASVFDISGVMLRMSLSQAESALLKRGYKLLSQHYEIPNFIKWRYEEKCRDNGVVGYERLNSCVVKAAKAGNYQFVESARFEKTDSKENIIIWLTSNFTKNKVYKIAYETGITGINRGSGEKIAYLRSIKIYEFWRRINQKYGTPDNKDDVLWGLGANKPYMKAATGRLLLEDPMLRELDFTRMSREDQKFMNTNLYNF